MRKSIISFLLAIIATATMAQTNPKPGYVITNTGDTIRGVIDFRTNEKLSKQCQFWANGEKEGKVYLPGDIEGFRFDNNGKYFVARRLNVTGTPELYFAEFMVQGKMNLYCVTYKADEYYFFEREDGEMAELTNRYTSYMSIDAAVQGTKDIVKEKKRQYGKVKMLLQQSKSAVADMDDNNMTRKKLVNVVRDYHNEVCTDGSSCMVYEYNEKTDRVKTHLKAFAGFAYYSTEMTDMQSDQDMNFPGSTYEIGVGVEIDLERVMKDFSVEFGLGLTPKYKSTCEEEGVDKTYSYTYEKSILTFAVGGVKRFGNGKIRPIVRAGGFAVAHLSAQETWGYKSKYGSTSSAPNTWGTSTHFGVYVGGGVQIPVGKHFARVHADLYKSLEPTSMGQMTKWALTAEFAL
jgi:hypothetical protein